MLLLALVLPACTAQDKQAWQAFSHAYAANLRAQQAQQESQQVFVAPPCNSDFDCAARQYGDVCVKERLSFQGTCMTPVDHNGMALPARMPVNNVGVMGRTAGGCRFDYQCHVGFRCDVGTGACVR